jgi:hypothetical protein
LNCSGVISFSGEKCAIGDHVKGCEAIARDQSTDALLAVAVLLALEDKAEVLFDEPQQVGFRNLIFQRRK